MKSKLAFVFRHHPIGTSHSREGLDMLLATTAFCDENDIAVYFIDDGIFNLFAHQQPQLSLQKDCIVSFKLLDLYDIEHRYVCSQSLQRFKLGDQNLVLNCEEIDRTLLTERLNQAEKIMVF